MVGMREEGGEGRGDARGMQARLQGARPFGVARVPAVHRLGQPEAEVHLPAHPVEVGNLPRAKAGREVRQEDTGALRGLDPDEAEKPRVLVTTAMPIGVNSPPVEDKRVVRQEGIDVGPRTKLLRDLSSGARVHLRLPVLCEPNDAAHMRGVAGPQARQAGVGQVGAQAAPLPGRVDRQRPTVMLPGGAAMVAHRRPAPDGEDLMHLDGGVVPSPRKCLTQGVTPRDRRGIDDVPILHATKRTSPIDRLRLSVRQGPLGQGFHELFQGHVAPPLEGGSRHVGHLTLQIRAQDIRLVGSPRCPRRDHHGPHAHPEVQLALSRNDAKRCAEPVKLLLGQHRLEDLPYLITCHGLALRSVSSYPVMQIPLQKASKACGGFSVKRPSIAVPRGLS